MGSMMYKHSQHLVLSAMELLKMRRILLASVEGRTKYKHKANHGVMF